MVKNLYKLFFVHHYLLYKKLGRRNPQIQSSLYTWFLYSMNILSIYSVLLFCGFLDAQKFSKICVPTAIAVFIINEFYLRRNNFFINEIQELTPIVKRNKIYFTMYEVISFAVLLFLVWLNHK